MKIQPAIKENQNQNNSEERVRCFHEKLVDFRVKNEGKLDIKKVESSVSRGNCLARGPKEEGIIILFE